MILTAETAPEARLKHQLDDLERMLHQLTVLDRADGPEELNRAIDELLCCMGDYTHAPIFLSFLRRTAYTEIPTNDAPKVLCRRSTICRPFPILKCQPGTHPFFPASSSSSPMFPPCARSCWKHCPNAAKNDKKRPEILI